MDSEGSPRTILFRFEMKLQKRQAVDLSSHPEKEHGETEAKKPCL